VFARSSDASGTALKYHVRAGDTLWSIAQKRYGGDPRAGVWKIQQRNRLTDAGIYPGELLVLP
jgi:LysM repeat protein